MFQKTLSLEGMSNRKILSECSNGQYNLCRDHDDESSSTEKVISSNASKATMDTENFIFPGSVNTEGNPLMEGHTPALGNVNYLTPNKNKFETEASYENSPNQAVPVIDFASLQAADFGITPESFTKLCKGESKSMLKKFRRRSTIGVRGSPENNSLIKYIAFLKGRKKRESLSQASPSKFCSTLLKNKIAAFQASFQPPEEPEERINQIPSVRNSVTPETSDRTGKQSKLGLMLPSASRSVAVEENQTHNPVNEESRAAPTQVVPGLQESVAESDYKGSPPQLSSAELSNAPPPQSCKKVRFAEKLDLKIFDTEPPITPVRKEGTHSNPHRSVLKNTPRRPLTENVKVPSQQSLEVEPVSGSAINSDMEETPSVSSVLQPASVRITRSSVKRKAASHKSFGKRRKRRRKKEKTASVQRETVSRKPLLSPILEAAEDLSWVTSCPITPELEMSISDNCQSNALPTVLVNANVNKALHSTGKYCLDSKLVQGKEAESSGIPSSLCPGLQESAVNILETGLPWNPPGEDALERLESQCPLSNELQEELLKTGKDNESKRDSIPVTNSAADMTQRAAKVNFKSCSRRSKKLTCHLPSAESFDSESLRKNCTVSQTHGGDPPSSASTGNDSENLNDLACWIEESFRSGGKSTQKRVRRSMRGLKDSETEGLAWVLLPASSGVESVLLSPCKGQRCISSPTHKEPELFHQEQVRGKNRLLPRKGEQMAGVQVARRSSVSKRKRKSICVPNLEEKVTSPVWKNRRASLGYKRDHSYFP